MAITFDFGRNWAAFSTGKMNTQRLEAATQSLQDLVGSANIAGRTFLDIGCGSGLFSLAAAKCGAAEVVGFDINPTSVQVSENNWKAFAGSMSGSTTPRFCTGNILDAGFLAERDAFDIVYAWGVLHHTGAMWDAIRNAAALVHPHGGTFVLAIYSRHRTSPLWKQIKRLYNLSPRPIQGGLNYLFAALMYIGVWLTTRQNPLNKPRGMDFWYDVVDWLGGYPYEYAGITEITSFVHNLGFHTERVIPTAGWTGCNEFVFRRAED